MLASLPEELLTQICLNVTEEDEPFGFSRSAQSYLWGEIDRPPPSEELCALPLVCRAMKVPGNTALYRYIYLPGKRSTKRLLKTLQTHSQYSLRTAHIEFGKNDKANQQITFKLFKAILNLCPALTGLATRNLPVTFFKVELDDEDYEGWRELLAFYSSLTRITSFLSKSAVTATPTDSVVNAGDGLEFLFGRWPSKEIAFPNLRHLSLDSYVLFNTDFKRFGLSSLQSLSLHRVTYAGIFIAELLPLIMEEMPNLKELTCVGLSSSVLVPLLVVIGPRLTRLGIDSDIRVLKQIPVLSRSFPPLDIFSNLERLYLRRFNLSKWIPSQRKQGEDYRLPFDGNLKELALVECRSNKTGGFLSNLVSLCKRSPDLKDVWISTMEGANVVNESEQGALTRLRDLLESRNGYTGTDIRNLCVKLPEEEAEVEGESEQEKESFLHQPIAAIPLPDIKALSSPMKSSSP